MKYFATRARAVHFTKDGAAQILLLNYRLQSVSYGKYEHSLISDDSPKLFFNLHLPLRLLGSVCSRSTGTATKHVAFDRFDFKFHFHRISRKNLA